MRAAIREHVFAFLTSVKVAVVLTALIAAATAAGTLMPAEAASERIYRSAWFASLIGLFCLNLLCCAFKSIRSPSKFLGVFVMHAGIVVVVAGGAGTRFYGDRGFMTIREGERSGTYVAAGGEERRLGFDIYLDDFGIEYYPPRVSLRRPGGGEVESFVPKEGSPRQVLRGACEITLERYFPTFEAREEVLETPECGEEGGAPPIRAGPGVEVTVSSLEEPRRTEALWIFPTLRGKDRLENEGGRFAMTAVLCDSREEFESRTRAAGAQGSHGFIFARIATPSTTRRVPAEPGTEQALGGSLTLRVEEVVAASGVRAGSGAGRPGVEVRLSGPRGEERCFVPAVPGGGDLTRARVYGDVGLTYQPRAQGPPDRLELVRAPSGEWASVLGREGRALSALPLAPGEPIRVEGMPFTVALRRVVEEAWLRRSEMSTDPRPRRPVVRLRFRTERAEETHLLPAGQAWQAVLGGAVEVSTDGKVDTVKEFASTLAVYEGDREVLRKTIRVNEPLGYGGYAFYQASYDEERLDSTGLMVVRDPGNAVVYTGFGLLAFGLVYASFVQPLFSLRKHR